MPLYNSSHWVCRELSNTAGYSIYLLFIAEDRYRFSHTELLVCTVTTLSNGIKQLKLIVECENVNRKYSEFIFLIIIHARHSPAPKNFTV